MAFRHRLLEFLRRLRPAPAATTRPATRPATRLTAAIPELLSSPSLYAATFHKQLPANTCVRHYVTAPAATTRPVTRLTATIPELLSSPSLYAATFHKQLPANTCVRHYGTSQDDNTYNSEDFYYELVFDTRYKYVNGAFYLEAVNLHGLWKCKMVKKGTSWEKVPVNNPRYRDRTKKAQELLEKFKVEHPAVFSKMQKYWTTTNRQADPDKLWVRENLKHGDEELSISYWIKTIELADEYFDDNGVCVFHKIMEEQNFVKGKFSGTGFQTTVSDKFGFKVSTTFKEKGSDKLYPKEFSVFMDKTYKKMDHPETVLPHTEFYLDGKN